MACPICDQKPMNCDCTDRERRMWREINDVEELRLTDAERTLLGRLACEADHPRAWTNRALTADDRATLRDLLERMK